MSTPIESFDVWATVNKLMEVFRASVKATEPIGSDETGYLVSVKGMEPDELAPWVLSYTADPEKLAQVASAAIAALVLRDYQQDNPVTEEEVRGDG